MKKLSAILLQGILYLMLFVQCSDDVQTNNEKNQEKDTCLSCINDKPVYCVTVNGKEIRVDTCRVSAMPVTMYSNGDNQRSLDWTELAYFSYCDMQVNDMQVTVVSGRKIQSVKINPVSYNIQPEIKGDTILFKMPKTGSVTVEINGTHHALHLFVSPPEKNVPTQETSEVRYFGPGNHYPGDVLLQSNQSVYIAPGAVVYGRFFGENVSNIHIFGRGIIDGSQLPKGYRGHLIGFTSSTDITIEGVILRDPGSWGCAFFGCKRLNISGIKLIGCWRISTDGIDVCNCQDVKVENCFIRSFDDAIVVKGIKATPGQPSVLRNEFSGCVIWCDWGNALRIGGETYAPQISDVVFNDCDIIRTTDCAMEITSGDHATIENVMFSNIRVTINEPNQEPKILTHPEENFNVVYSDSHPNLMGLWINKTAYSTSPQLGPIRNIVFENISVTTNRTTPPSNFIGANEEYQITTVKIKDLTFNGQPIKNAKDAGLSVNSFVSGVVFE